MRPAPPSAAALIAELRTHASRRNVEGMGRFGISGHRTLGVPVPVLRRIARRVGKHHELAARLWASGLHEARILAGLVDEPARVTPGQMNRWCAAFDSWDVCDGVCSTLFDRTPFAYRKAVEWTRRRPEFVKRAGFVLMAALAVHDKAALDAAFLGFLPIIVRESTDDRNFVKKAVNWALRQIGKRNGRLNRAAIATAARIAAKGSPAARWIAADALRELTSAAVRSRLDARTQRARASGRARQGQRPTGHERLNQGR